MMSLVKAAQRRRDMERDQSLVTSRGTDVPTEARACPVCGGPSRPGAVGPCRACRPAELCLCGCGRPLWDRATLGLSRVCMVRVLAAFKAAPPALRRRVLAHLPDDE